MILKQRFAEGRTNYTDIGSDWMYIQFHADEFNKISESLGLNDNTLNECLGFIHSGDRNAIPIYKNYPQWIYSNDGKLFMTLVGY